MASEFEIQTAVMDSLPHAIHPMHDNWRAKADALIAGLLARGFVVVPVADMNGDNNNDN